MKIEEKVAPEEEGLEAHVQIRCGHGRHNGVGRRNAPFLPASLHVHCWEHRNQAVPNMAALTR